MLIGTQVLKLTLQQTSTINRCTSTAAVHRKQRVFARDQILFWVEKHRNISMQPMNSPTQGLSPTPRKIWSKVQNGPPFSHCTSFFVGWDWFHTGNRQQETQPNPTKILRKHPTTGVHSNQDLILCATIGLYMGFCVHRGSWLLCPPVIPGVSFVRGKRSSQARCYPLVSFLLFFVNIIITYADQSCCVVIIYQVFYFCW